MYLFHWTSIGNRMENYRKAITSASVRPMVVFPRHRIILRIVQCHRRRIFLSIIPMQPHRRQHSPSTEEFIKVNLRVNRMTGIPIAKYALVNLSVATARLILFPHHRFLDHRLPPCLLSSSNNNNNNKITIEMRIKRILGIHKRICRQLFTANPSIHAQVRIVNYDAECLS